MASSSARPWLIAPLALVACRCEEPLPVVVAPEPGALTIVVAGAGSGMVALKLPPDGGRTLLRRAERLLVWSLPAAVFQRPDGAPLALEDLARAEIQLDVAGGRCAARTSSAPVLVHPGDACPLPSFIAPRALRVSDDGASALDDPALDPEARSAIEEARARVRLVWPPDGACDRSAATGATVPLGERCWLRPEEDPIPPRAVAIGPDGDVAIAAGRELIRIDPSGRRTISHPFIGNAAFGLPGGRFLVTIPCESSIGCLTELFRGDETPHPIELGRAGERYDGVALARDPGEVLLVGAARSPIGDRPVIVRCNTGDPAIRERLGPCEEEPIQCDDNPEGISLAVEAPEDGFGVAASNGGMLLWRRPGAAWRCVGPTFTGPKGPFAFLQVRAVHLLGRRVLVCGEVLGEDNRSQVLSAVLPDGEAAPDFRSVWEGEGICGSWSRATGSSGEVARMIRRTIVGDIPFAFDFGSDGALRTSWYRATSTTSTRTLSFEGVGPGQAPLALIDSPGGWSLLWSEVGAVFRRPPAATRFEPLRGPTSSETSYLAVTPHPGGGVIAVAADRLTRVRAGAAGTGCDAIRVDELGPPDLEDHWPAFAFVSTPRDGAPELELITQGHPYTVGRVRVSLDGEQAGALERLGTGYVRGAVELTPGRTLILIEDALLDLRDGSVRRVGLDPPAAGWWSLARAGPGVAYAVGGPWLARVTIGSGGELRVERIDVRALPGGLCAGPSSEGMRQGDAPCLTSVRAICPDELLVVQDDRWFPPDPLSVGRSVIYLRRISSSPTCGAVTRDASGLLDLAACPDALARQVVAGVVEIIGSGARRTIVSTYGQLVRPGHSEPTALEIWESRAAVEGRLTLVAAAGGRLVAVLEADSP